jgi:hypothetical protein
MFLAGNSNHTVIYGVYIKGWPEPYINTRIFCDFPAQNTGYTPYIHCIYTGYIPVIHRIYTVYIWFWLTLCIYGFGQPSFLPADLCVLCLPISPFSLVLPFPTLPCSHTDTHTHTHTLTHTHTYTHTDTHTNTLSCSYTHVHYTFYTHVTRSTRMSYISHVLHACHTFYTHVTRSTRMSYISHILHACHTFYTHVMYITRSTRMSHVLHACHIYLYITRSTRMSYISLYHMFYTHVIYITHSTRMSYISHVLHACHIHHTFYTHVNYKQQAEAEGEWEKLQESQGEFCYHSLCHLLLDMCHAILLSFFVSSVAGYVSCNFVIFLCVICCWICVMQF